MNIEDKDRFIKLLAGIAVYYKDDFLPEIQKVYWDDLKQFSFDEINDAANQHRKDPKHGDFMPKVSDFMRYLKPKDNSEALIVFSEVMYLAARKGRRNKPDFDNDVIEAAIRGVGGWDALCDSLEKDRTFLERRFKEHYEAAKDRHLIEKKMLVFDVNKKVLPVLESTKSDETNIEKEDDEDTEINKTGTDG